MGTIAINDATSDGTGEVELFDIGAGGIGSGAITVTLPSSPSAGDIVSIADYGFNAATNNITIN